MWFATHCSSVGVLTPCVQLRNIRCMCVNAISYTAVYVVYVFYGCRDVYIYICLFTKGVINTYVYMIRASLRKRCLHADIKTIHTCRHLSFKTIYV